MNRISTYVALGALAALLSGNSIVSHAYAEMPGGALPQVKNSDLLLAANPPPSKPPTVNLGPIQQAIVALQAEADTDHNEIATLQSKLAVDEKTIAELESKLATLQTTSSAQQSSLSALRTSFLKHTHQYVDHAYSLGVETILTCPGGYGNPCVSGVGDKDITVLVPGGTRGGDVTLTTSPPQ